MTVEGAVPANLRELLLVRRVALDLGLPFSTAAALRTEAHLVEAVVATTADPSATAPHVTTQALNATLRPQLFPAELGRVLFIARLHGALPGVVPRLLDALLLRTAAGSARAARALALVLPGAALCFGTCAFAAVAPLIVMPSSSASCASDELASRNSSVFEAPGVISDAGDIGDATADGAFGVLGFLQPSSPPGCDGEGATHQQHQALYAAALGGIGRPSDAALCAVALAVSGVGVPRVAGLLGRCRVAVCRAPELWTIDTAVLVCQWALDALATQPPAALAANAVNQSSDCCPAFDSFGTTAGVERDGMESERGEQPAAAFDSPDGVTAAETPAASEGKTTEAAPTVDSVAGSGFSARAPSPRASLHQQHQQQQHEDPTKDTAAAGARSPTARTPYISTASSFASSGGASASAVGVGGSLPAAAVPATLLPFPDKLPSTPTIESTTIVSSLVLAASPGSLGDAAVVVLVPWLLNAMNTTAIPLAAAALAHIFLGAGSGASRGAAALRRMANGQRVADAVLAAALRVAVRMHPQSHPARYADAAPVFLHLAFVCLCFLCGPAFPSDATQSGGAAKPSPNTGNNSSNNGGGLTRESQTELAVTVGHFVRWALACGVGGAAEQQQQPPPTRHHRQHDTPSVPSGVSSLEGGSTPESATPRGPFVGDPSSPTPTPTPTTMAAAAANAAATEALVDPPPVAPAALVPALRLALRCVDLALHDYASGTAPDALVGRLAGLLPLLRRLEAATPDAVCLSASSAPLLPGGGGDASGDALAGWPPLPPRSVFADVLESVLAAAEPGVLSALVTTAATANGGGGTLAGFLPCAEPPGLPPLALPLSCRRWILRDTCGELLFQFLKCAAASSGSDPACPLRLQRPASSTRTTPGHPFLVAAV